MSPSALVEVNNLFYTYMPGTPFERRAIDGVSFKINQGEAVGIVGATGSGKSTLVQMLNGLLLPDSGDLCVDGHAFSRGNTKALEGVRFALGLLFQFPEQQLFDETVFSDVCFGPRNMGLSESEVSERADWAMRLVNLPPEVYATRSPFALSGGEKRRAALAGVLAMRPKCLVLDEPTAGLDPLGAKSVLNLLKELHKNQDLTLIVISHRFNELAGLVQRLLVMAKGQLQEDAPLREVLYNFELLHKCFLEPTDICLFVEELRKLQLIPDNAGPLPISADEAYEFLRSFMPDSFFIEKNH